MNLLHKMKNPFSQYVKYCIFISTFCLCFGGRSSNLYAEDVVRARLAIEDGTAEPQNFSDEFPVVPLLPGIEELPITLEEKKQEPFIPAPPAVDPKPIAPRIVKNQGNPRSPLQAIIQLSKKRDIAYAAQSGNIKLRKSRAVASDGRSLGDIVRDYKDSGSQNSKLDRAIKQIEVILQDDLQTLSRIKANVR